jgi:hypothetical protein
LQLCSAAEVDWLMHAEGTSRSSIDWLPIAEIAKIFFEADFQSLVIWWLWVSFSTQWRSF